MKLAATERRKGRRVCPWNSDATSRGWMAGAFDSRTGHSRNRRSWHPAPGRRVAVTPRARRGEPSYSVAASSRALVRVGLAVLQQKKTPVETAGVFFCADRG